MKESQFGFEYSWSDTKPIRILVVTMLIIQLSGAGTGLWISRYPSWFENLWAGTALATFPGFLLGLILQRYFRPGSIKQNGVINLVIVRVYRAIRGTKMTLIKLQLAIVNPATPTSDEIT